VVFVAIVGMPTSISISISISTGIGTRVSGDGDGGGGGPAPSAAPPSEEPARPDVSETQLRDPIPAGVRPALLVVVVPARSGSS